MLALALNRPLIPNKQTVVQRAKLCGAPSKNSVINVLKRLSEKIFQVGAETGSTHDLEWTGSTEDGSKKGKRLIEEH